MAETEVLPGGHETCLGCTQRTDSWWAGPTATFLGLLLFVVYSTWAAMQGAHYYAEPYLSPFYSPVLVTQVHEEDDAGRPRSDAAGDPVPVDGHAPPEHAWFGERPDWLSLPIVGFSPAFLILIFPGAFRFTCYYYRKAYYRSFIGSPPGCAVGPSPNGFSPSGYYRGETHLLLFQNLHRIALYFALVFIVILTYDGLIAFHHAEHGFGVGVGTVVLCLNALFLAGYTFGCHSFRHLVGGVLNVFSKHRGRYTVWKGVTWLNERHMQFAWLSLFWVGFADVYVRLYSMGIIPDLNTWPS